MSMPTKHNVDIILRYMDQPEVMPTDLRRKIENQWGGQPVQLYALADLDPTLKLGNTWVALGPEQIAIVEGETIRNVDRSRISAIRENAGMSCSSITLLSGEAAAALATLRYSHRQKRSIENIRFVLEQAIQGHTVNTRNPDETYTEALSFAVKEAQASVSGNRFKVVLRLLGYLFPYRRQLTLGMGAAGLMTLASLIPPYLSGFLVDRVIRPFQEGHLEREGAGALATKTLLVIAGVYLLREFFAWIRFRTMSMLGEYVAHDLRDDLYGHLQLLSISFFSKKQTGSIISRVSSDTDRIWDFIAFGVVEVSISLIMLIGLGTTLIYLDWRLGLIMTLPVPILLYAIYRHGERMQQLFLRAWRRWSDLTEVLSDTIPGIRVVKAFAQEKREKTRFDQRNRAAVSEFEGIHRAWTSFWPRLTLSISAIVLTVWIFALPRLLGETGDSALTVGTFVSFLLYMAMFPQPIEVIGQMARMLNRATSSAHRVFELLDTEPNVIDRDQAKVLSSLEGRVQFENVCFGYDGVRQIIRGISFDVKPGEVIGLVGSSGGGKTTLINLLMRFYDVTSGRVLVDGNDICDLDMGHYRRQIGMVLQDPFLFFGTILENIRYGVPEATLDDVIQAARTANAHDFIVKLPQAYDTVIGERGHTLSGGERQRVSIARAILLNPRMLILDEATSSVDTETERKIQEALDRLVQNRTVFAIAHRLSTLKKATRLFVIQDGKLVEQGTHAELLAKPDGAYTKLHRLQSELHENHVI